MPRRSLAVCALLLLMATAARGQDDAVRTARLTPAPVEAATAAALTGSGAARGVLAGTTLTITGTFSGLQAPATIANLHAGERGLRGPVVAALDLDGGTDGTFRAELRLSDVQAGYFRDQRLYIQIQNEDAPDGLLRGWLVRPEE